VPQSKLTVRDSSIRLVLSCLIFKKYIKLQLHLVHLENYIIFTLSKYYNVFSQQNEEINFFKKEYLVKKKINLQYILIFEACVKHKNSENIKTERKI